VTHYWQELSRREKRETHATFLDGRGTRGTISVLGEVHGRTAGRNRGDLEHGPKEGGDSRPEALAGSQDPESFGRKCRTSFWDCKEPDDVGDLKSPSGRSVQDHTKLEKDCSIKGRITVAPRADARNNHHFLGGRRTPGAITCGADFGQKCEEIGNSIRN